MAKNYLGKLDFYDPLYSFLREEVYSTVKEPTFHVDHLSANHLVYKYTEEKTRIAVIGKFYRLSEPRREKVERIMAEYDNLLKIRSYGFIHYPNYVVKPIGREEQIGLALLEEYIRGKDLDYYLRKAIFNNDTDALKAKLKDLASFLAVFHEKTHNDRSVDLEPISGYFGRIINKLKSQMLLSREDYSDLLRLMNKWLSLPFMQEAKEVIVHGDATPTNFIFTHDNEVVAIDLERMRMSDRLYDIGMVCGEIKHSFLWRRGDPYASESFIRYFLKNYSDYLGDKAFYEITRRNPFYMALTELRIARNNWLDWDYRKRLIWEARQCLYWGLKLR